MSKKCVTHRLASSVKKASLLAIILLVKELAKCHKRYHTGKKPLPTTNLTNQCRDSISADGAVVVIIGVVYPCITDSL